MITKIVFSQIAPSTLPAVPILSMLPRPCRIPASLTKRFCFLAVHVVVTVPKILNALVHFRTESRSILAIRCPLLANVVRRHAEILVVFLWGGFQVRFPIHDPTNDHLFRIISLLDKQRMNERRHVKKKHSILQFTQHAFFCKTFRYNGNNNSYSVCNILHTIHDHNAT